MRRIHLLWIGVLALSLFGAARGPLPILARDKTDQAIATESCQWLFSAGGAGNYQPLLNDPDNTPIDDLRFGEPYSSVHLPLAGDGFLDFNGDNRSDVFRVTPHTDGLLQWQYLPGGMGTWVNLAVASAPPADLRFGDFDGNGRTDVLTAVPSTDGNYRLLYSRNGTDNYLPLNIVDTRLADLRFGDFDDDGKTDLFRVTPRADGLLQWQYAPGGAGAWVNLAYASTPLADLRFGEFDGDGKTDVFTAVPSQGSTYFYSPGGVGNYTPLRLATTPLADVRFGDFDGDGKTDMFRVTPRADGLLQWQYSPGAASEFLNLAYASTPLADLRFGEFDGGNTTDVFAAPCGLQPPARTFPDPFADRVLGQKDLNSSASAISDQALHGPAAVAVAPGGRLFVADYNNNRVLGWPSAVAFNKGDPADIVLGQADFTHGDPNRGTDGPPNQSGISGPESLAFDRAGRLFVADNNNHRVLVFDGPFLPGAGKPASAVIGGPDVPNPAGERCSNPTNKSFCFPRGLAFDPAGNLYVADQFHHRVMIFAPPFSDESVATRVIGQPDLSTGGGNWEGPLDVPPAMEGAYGLNGPRGVAVDTSGNLYVADSANNRVLRFNTPITTGKGASGVFGQTSMLVHQEPPNIGIYRLNFPIDLAFDRYGNLYVSDLNNHRVVQYDAPLTSFQAANRVFGYKTLGPMECGSTPEPDPVPNLVSLRCPLGLTVDPLGNLLVADFYNNRVLAFDVSSYRTFLSLVER